MISISIGIWLAGAAAGYFFRGMKRPKKTKPAPSYCAHSWVEPQDHKPAFDWVTYTCLRIHNTCRSGFCSKHCKSQGCDCLKPLDKAEQELLEEFRKLA